MLMSLESALSYHKGTILELNNKDVILGLYWEMLSVSGDRIFLTSLHIVA